MSFTHSLHAAPWKFLHPREKRWHAAIVPGCIHADLRRQQLIADPFWGSHERDLAWIEEETWTYATEFTVPVEINAEEEIDLVADGLDTVARIVLNGHEIARTENMFIGYRWPVKDILRSGRNRLEIHFDSPMDYIRTHRREHQPREINDPAGGCTRIRKQQCAFGWDWGPRLVTSGIWKAIGLHAWSGNRLTTVHVHQRHRRGAVTLELAPELARPAIGAMTFQTTLSLGGKIVARSTELSLRVPAPQRWWPQGQGAQPLYTLTVECREAGRVIDRWARRIGLREITLDRHADQWGESFQFTVNGRAIFAKGANWIPAHALTAGLVHADYEPLLRAAASAHMNMIRVWGGGIYEHDDFYDLCDELGLLVWQDFMFACTLYPGDREFLRSVECEARQQVKRLRHHASLALWCGNNEIESLNGDALQKSPALRTAHDDLFERLLRTIVAQHDDATAYWRSSPLGSQTEGVAKTADKLTGDWHDWDVWHARQPVKSYETSRTRFASEFGMQSFCSPAIAATFCEPADWNIFSTAMENHQKNPAGNAIILDYVSRLYRFPRDYRSLAYLSQLNQAWCMKIAVEHWRRAQPRTMGALYWQLNDCWPVASWSSLEFGGRWKPLHHAARRFFAPLLVSAHVHGDEAAGIGNRLKSTTGAIDLYSVYDDPKSRAGRLSWSLLHLNGRVLRRGMKRVRLIYGQSVKQSSLDFAREIAAHGRDQLLLKISLSAPGLTSSEDVVLFTAPRQLNLPIAKIAVTIALAKCGWTLVVSSKAYQHRVWLEVEGARCEWSDNAFDLLPGETRELTLKVITEPRLSRVELRKRLRVSSLRDTY